MRKADNKKDLPLSCLPGETKTVSDVNEDAITEIDRRKEILNTVVEKLIDKINETRKEGTQATKKNKNS